MLPLTSSASPSIPTHLGLSLALDAVALVVVLCVDVAELVEVVAQPVGHEVADKAVDGLGKANNVHGQLNLLHKSKQWDGV